VASDSSYAHADDHHSGSGWVDENDLDVTGPQGYDSPQEQPSTRLPKCTVHVIFAYTPFCCHGLRHHHHVYILAIIITVICIFRIIAIVCITRILIPSGCFYLCIF